MPESRFEPVFRDLKAILSRYAADLDVTVDEAGRYALQTPYSPKWKKPLAFGEVKVGKRYVSFHLMPVYMYPDLLDSVSDGLRGRMQGKACFNFTSVDDALFDELGQLVEWGYERLRTDCR